MQKNSTPAEPTPLFAGAAWFDPIEAELRERVRLFLEEMVEQEATAALGRGRYQRGASAGYRNGTRSRRLLGSFGPVEIAVPRARLLAPDGTSREWQSAVLPRYARMTRQVEALIAAAYLAGTNTRRVKRALGALFKGAIGKDVVSRVWRKVKTDWEAWTRRDLAQEDLVRLILDGSVVRVRLDRKATNISLLAVLGVRRDGQKILLAVRNMGGESEAAWRGVLDDLVGRGLRAPEFLIIDGAAGLEKALGALWPEVPTQRCTVHKHRNLLAHAPDALHDEISADYNDMIYAKTAKESIRDHSVCWQSFRSIRRTEAQRRKASAFRLRHSQSFARRRQRLSQPIVLSTIQRLGSTTNRLTSQRLTISTLTCAHAAFSPSWNFAP